MLGVAEAGRALLTTVAERATGDTGAATDIGDTTLDLRHGFVGGWIGVADFGRCVAVEADAGDCFGVATVAARVSGVEDTPDCFWRDEVDGGGEMTLILREELVLRAGAADCGRTVATVATVGFR